MRVQALARKWLLYALALLPLCILEGVVFGRVTLFGARPSLLPLAVVVVAVLEGSTAGAGYGLYVGGFTYLLNPGSYGVFLFALSLLGLLAGLLFHRGIGHNFAACLIGSALALLALTLGRLVFYALKGGARPGALLHIAGPEFFWSMVFFPLVYGLYHLVHHRVGRLTPL